MNLSFNSFLCSIWSQWKRVLALAMVLGQNLLYTYVSFSLDRAVFCSFLIGLLFCHFFLLSKLIFIVVILFRGSLILRGWRGGSLGFWLFQICLFQEVHLLVIISVISPKSPSLPHWPSVSQSVFLVIRTLLLSECPSNKTFIQLSFPHPCYILYWSPSSVDSLSTLLSRPLAWHLALNALHYSCIAVWVLYRLQVLLGTGALFRRLFWMQHYRVWRSTVSVLTLTGSKI